MNEAGRFSASASGGENNDPYMISAFIMQQQQQQQQQQQHDQFATGRRFLSCTEYPSAAAHGGHLGPPARMQSSLGGDQQYGSHEGFTASAAVAASSGGGFGIMGAGLGGMASTSQQAQESGIPAHAGAGLAMRIPVSSGGGFLAAHNGGCIPAMAGSGFAGNGGSNTAQGMSSIPAPGGGLPAPPSRYESQKRRDWNTFGQYLRNSRPPLPLARCNGDHVLQFLRYLDQFGKTKVHAARCPYFGLPHPPGPCECPLRQAWGSLDALIGRLRAAYEEHGGKPESNPFGARAVRMYLREVRELQAKARGIAYEKKKRKRPKPPAAGSANPGAMAPAASTTTIPPNVYHSAEPPGAPSSTAGYLIPGCN